MSRILTRIAGFFTNRTVAGVDKTGNKYFTRTDEIDGIVKEKRWVVFKGEQDPTSIPVEWICWLNGQRKLAPTPEELAELEARREQIRLNVARLKEEEEKKLKEGGARKGISIGKLSGPDLKSFVQQFPAPSEEGVKAEDSLDKEENLRKPEEKGTEEAREVPLSSEPTGSGASFKPGTWQPPT